MSSNSSSSEGDDELGGYADLMDVIDEEEESGSGSGSSSSPEDDAMEQSSTSEEEEEEEEEKEPEPEPEPEPKKKKRKRAKKAPKAEPEPKKKKKATPTKKKAETKPKTTTKKRKAPGAATAAAAVPKPKPTPVALALLGEGRWTRNKKRNPSPAERKEGDTKPIDQLGRRHAILRRREGLMCSFAQTHRWMNETFESTLKSPLIDVMFASPIPKDRVYCISSNAKTSGLMQSESFIQKIAQAAHRVLRLRVRNRKPTADGKQPLGMLYKQDVDEAVRLGREYRDACSRVFI